eukprot:374382_1
MDLIEMTVYSYGYQAGSSTHFICRGGSICNVYCVGNGCNEMEFICLYGAQCNVFPVECASDDIVDGIDCPIQTISLSTKDDAKLTEFMNVEKEEKETHYQLITSQQKSNLAGLNQKINPKSMEFYR